MPNTSCVVRPATNTANFTHRLGLGVGVMHLSPSVIENEVTAKNTDFAEKHDCGLMPNWKGGG